MIAYDAFNSWGEAWAVAMSRALFDASALLALVLVIWLPLRRRISAQLAHGLFCLVLLRLAVPQSLPWPSWLPAPTVRQLVDRAWASSQHVPLAARSTAGLDPPAAFALPTTGDLVASAPEIPQPAPVVAVSPRAARPLKDAFTSPLSTRAWLMLAWAAVALVLLARFARAVLATRALIREALPIDPEWLPVDVVALQKAVGLRTPVRWAVSHRLRTPAVGGLFRPTVVMPPDLDDGLTPQQLRWVLLHELAHVRRGDLWVVMIQRLIQSIFFFHPAVHAANWVIDQLREYACDDAALAASQAPRRDCGEGFLTVVGRSVEPASASTPVAFAAVALGLFESRMLIRRRLVRILDPRRKVHARLSTRASIGLVAAAALVVAFGRAGDASARPRGPLELASVRTGSLAVEMEPLTYRPGELWHRESPSQGEGATSPTARSSVLALAYSADGSTLATAGEGPVIVLRDVRSGRVVARLVGHGDAVACLAFSPDGKTLASGGYDSTVRLWDFPTGRALAVLSGHANWVFALAFAPDGKTLASAGHDQSIRLWDVPSGVGRDVLSGLAGSVRALAFSPDGATLASGGADRVVTLWDVTGRVPRGRLEGHRGSIRALAFAPRGAASVARLASSGEDGEVRLWETGPEHAGLVATLAGHPDMAVCLAFSPGGTTLATGGLDATVKLWDPVNGRERATLRGHLDGVSALAFAPRAGQLASAGFDGAVRLWEPAAPAFSPAACWIIEGPARGLGFAADGRALFTLGATGLARWDAVTGSPLPAAGGSDRAPTMSGSRAVSLDGAIHAEGTADGSVRLVEVSSGRLLAELKGHQGLVVSVAFAPNGRALATAGVDGTVKLWNLAARRLTAREALKPEPTCPWSVAYSADGRTLAIADGRSDAPGVITLWDVSPSGGRRPLEGHDRGVSAVACSRDGRLIASGSFDQTVRLWDARTGACRYVIDGLNGVVTDLAFSPDGKTLATASEVGSVTLWEAETGAESARLDGFLGRVQSVAFSPDGRLVAAGGGVFESGPTARGEVKVWDAATHRALDGFNGHTRGVASVAFSPDGCALASGGLDECLRVWDVATGRARLVLSGRPGCVLSLGYSRDGRTLAWSGRNDGLVVLLDATTGAEVARLVGHTSAVRSLAFSPDGSTLATAGADRAVKLWDAPTKR